MTLAIFSGLLMIRLNKFDESVMRIPHMLQLLAFFLPWPFISMLKLTSEYIVFLNRYKTAVLAKHIYICINLI